MRAGGVIHSPRAHLLSGKTVFHFSACLNSTVQKNKMPHKPKQETHASPQSVAVLLWLSFALWLYSLLGVGFQSYETWYGAEILFTGTFLGWIGCIPWIAGLAVYANYFYLFAWCRLAWGTKAPAVSTSLMLLFASFTFQLQETAKGESGHTADVYAWGWGAVWWGLSLATLTIATCARAFRISQKVTIPLTAAIYATVLLPLYNSFLHQYNTANTQEKSRYFAPGTSEIVPAVIDHYFNKGTKTNSKTSNKNYSAAYIFLSGGTAFVVDEDAFSHIEYTPPPPTLPENAVLQINGKIDFSSRWALVTDDFKIDLPRSFVHQGKLYQRQNRHYTKSFFDWWDASFIKVTPFSGHVDYVLSLSQPDSRGVYRFTIADENKKSVFYQADMVKKRGSAYPFSDYADYTYPENKPAQPPDSPAVITEKCAQESSMVIHDGKIHFSINNQDFMLVSGESYHSHSYEDEMIKNFRQHTFHDPWCSEQLVLFPVQNARRFLLFDKRNMQLIAEFKTDYDGSDREEREKFDALQNYLRDHLGNENANITFTYRNTPTKPDDRPDVHHYLLVRTPVGETELFFYGFPAY